MILLTLELLLLPTPVHMCEHEGFKFKSRK